MRLFGFVRVAIPKESFLWEFSKETIVRFPFVDHKSHFVGPRSVGCGNGRWRKPLLVKELDTPPMAKITDARNLETIHLAPAAYRASAF